MIGKEGRKIEELCISRIIRMGSDSRLLSTHISILNAMFICWQHNSFCEPFSITRRKLMAYSKISSIATYHKRMSELIALMYIRYRPSYHPHKGSLIWWAEPE
jgi:hypothetical protein